MLHRVMRVEFSTPMGVKRLDGIDVNFSATKFMSGVMNEAFIDIYNLARSDIEYLTTYTSEFIAKNENKRIRVFAGYKETNLSLIYDGTIVNAIPTSPPDICLKCKALTNYFDNKKTISMNLTGNINLSNVCQYAAQNMKLALDFSVSSDKKLAGFSFTGNVGDMIKEIEEAGSYDVWFDSEALHIADKGKGNEKLPAKLVNENTGMIGIPKVDAVGCEVTILLDNSVEIGQKILLESIAIPSASGTYVIYEIKYDLNLRGNNYYMILKARRQ